MVFWKSLCRSTASLNPALQQYYAEETEEFYTNLANGLDNLFVSLGPETVRVEWLELAVSFLRTTHSEVHVLLDKLKHYGPLHSKSDPDWLQTYMEETQKLLDVCARLNPGIARIQRYQVCVELASRALSRLNMDAIQADLRRCLHRRQDSGGHGVKTGPHEDPGLAGGKARKRSPPSRESFEFPVTGSPAMDTSPVMPSSPLFAVDAMRKAERFDVSSPSKTRDGRADSLARDAAALKSQHVALEQGGSGGEESWDLGLEDLVSLVAEAEKLLYMRRPGSLSEPPPPPPGMFDPLVLPPALVRETSSPLRPFKLDSNFKIDVSPSKSSDSSSSPRSSKRRSSEMKSSPRKPPVHRNSDAKDSRKVSEEAEPGSSGRYSRQGSGGTEPGSSRHSRQVSGEGEPGSGKHSRHTSGEADSSSSKHSRQLSTVSSRSGVTLEQVSAPFVAQFEASLTALRECKEELEKEWRLSVESQKLIVDPLQTSSLASRSSLSASFTRYFRQRPNTESSRRKSSGEGSKLAQFLETLTAETDVEEDEAREGRGSSDGLNTISASAWVEKGADSMTRITERKEGHASESPSLLNVRDVKKVLSTGNKRVVDEPVKQPERRDLPSMKANRSSQETTAPESASQSRWGHLYSMGNPEPAPRMKGGHEKIETTDPVSLSLFGKQQTVRRTSGRRRSQSLDEVATERFHLDNLIVTNVQEKDPSPISKQDLLSPRETSEIRGSQRRSASFDGWKPYTPGGWQSERTEAIMRAYQNRMALTPSPDPRLEIRASEDGIDAKKRMADKVERVEVSGGASLDLSQTFSVEATDLVGGPDQRILSESQARAAEGPSLSDGRGRGLRRDTTVDMRTAMSHSRSIDSAPHRPLSASTNRRPRPLPEAKYMRPSNVRAGPENVASIVARFESFFDAEFDAKHDIKTAGRHASGDFAAAFESKMRVYDNPLHRAGPPSVSAATPVKQQRKSASSWRLDTGGFWRKSTSRSPSRSLDQDRKVGRRLSMSPRKSREHSKSSSSPGRLNLFSQVRHWVSHHHGEDDDTSKLQEASSSDLRRSRSSNLSKPTTPSHAFLKSPGRLNLITIQKGASSFVKTFGSVALKQCASPAAGSSRWSGLGGVLLATKASTGLVSTFVVWVLARKEAEIHPSRLLADYTDTKSEVHGHWASSLQRLQEKVAKFDSATRSLLLGVSNGNAADSQRPSSSSDHDRRGRRRRSLELKPRRSSSEHHRQDVDDYRSSGSMEIAEGNQRQSGGNEGSSSRRTSIQLQAGNSACIHIQELKDVHDYVEELHVGLERLFSSCLYALGKNRGELEQLPQEKIIREYVPSESRSHSDIPRRLFDKGGSDAVPAQEPTPIPMQHSSTSLQVAMGRKKSSPAEVGVLSPDSHNLEHKSYRHKPTQTASHQVSFSGSSFSFEVDNGIEEQLNDVEAIFEDWRSGKMAVTMRRLHQCKEEFRASLEAVSREVDDLFTELETGRRSMVD